jgi:hypothetical protein
LPKPIPTTCAAAVHAVDAQIALAEPKTLDQVREESLASERFTLILFASFAVLALSGHTGHLWRVGLFRGASDAKHAVWRACAGSLGLRLRGADSAGRSAAGLLSSRAKSGVDRAHAHASYRMTTRCSRAFFGLAGRTRRCPDKRLICYLGCSDAPVCPYRRSE